MGTMSDKEACGNCGAKNGCGCQAQDPYEASLQVVWHDPTEYNLMRHGPSYLPTKLAATERAQVRASLKQSAYYDTGNRLPGQAGPMAPLALLLACLRAVAHLHQTYHWQTRGGHYYGDHQLFMRLYDESQDFIDQVAERAVGAGSESLVDPLQQIEMMERVLKAVVPPSPWKGAAPEEMMRISLAAEQLLLGLLQAVIRQLESSGNLSPGTSNLLEGLSDKHEQFTYLLGQRTKTASMTAYTYDRR